MVVRTGLLLGSAIAALVTVILLGVSDARPAEVRADPRQTYDPIIAGEDIPGDGLAWPISRDGIRPIYDPEFISPGATAWSGDDLVIGVAIDGEARAYPVGLLGAREMVNDWIGDVPVLVTWCPLCGTAIAHERKIDGQAVLFGNQGALWGNAMTWWDHRTGSLWSQPIGEAIAGPLQGRRLDVLPSTFTTWAAWRADHPHTTALAGPTYDAGTRIDDLGIVVDLEGRATMYAIPALRASRVANDRVGNIDVVVVGPTDGAAWAVFGRDLAGRSLTFTHRDGALSDLETGTIWDTVTGRAISGPLLGEALPPLPASTVFPKDFPTFWPHGEVWSG